jgi:hypothetical protein
MTDSFGPITDPSNSTQNAVPALTPAQPALKPASLLSKPGSLLVEPAVARGVAVPELRPAFENQSNPPSLAEAGRALLRPAGPVDQSDLSSLTGPARELKKAFAKAGEKAKEKSALAELAALAQALNSESDDLNSTIQTINEKLRALNFGVEVWCKGSDGDYGFARVDDQWQLATQWDSEDFHGKKVKMVAPLIKQTRNERIEGLELAPEILRKLKSDAESKIAAIRKAKEFAASL